MATSKGKKGESESGTGAAGGGVKISVKSLTGGDVGVVQGSASAFSAEVTPHLVHATVVWQLSKARAGTHQALTRTLKEGGKKKPFKQKHTGRARAGSSVSPLWVGGASIHGPLPRSYETRLPKRTRRQALASVLTERLNNDAILVLESLNHKVGELKTKAVAQSFKALGLSGKKVLVVCGEGESGFAQAVRNISNVSILPVGGVNVYDMLAHDVMVLSKASVGALGKLVAE
jgi:large subunit ribosomal protein L4